MCVYLNFCFLLDERISEQGNVINDMREMKGSDKIGCDDVNYCVSAVCHMRKQSLPSVLPVKHNVGSPGHSRQIHTLCLLREGLRYELQ